MCVGHEDLHAASKPRTLHPLIGKLIAAEDLYGREGVAAKLDIKVRMYEYVRAGDKSLSARSLRAAARNFPRLVDDIKDYVAAAVLGDPKGHGGISDATC